jgi:DNA-binding response OmpR family regulator
MRVLIVEDEPRIARFLKEGLAQEGHAASTVSNGVAALGSARSHVFDLILLDWLLPDLDGLTVCRTLRAEGNTIPIIMLTAKDAVADRVSGLDGGADDYLTKPFEFEELFARIRSVTRRAAAGAAPELRVDDLLLDPAAHQVTRAGTPIALTRREFALLEYLMRRAGQVCTRAELLSHVWGYDHDPQTNVVDVYVGYLRRKVDRGFARTLLHAVPGLGYKLEG